MATVIDFRTRKAVAADDPRLTEWAAEQAVKPLTDLLQQVLMLGLAENFACERFVIVIPDLQEGRSPLIACAENLALPEQMDILARGYRRLLEIHRDSGKPGPVPAA